MKRTGRKTVQNLYNMVPVQRRPFERMTDGTIEVLLPRYGDGRVGRVLKMFLSQKPVRVRLDELGTSVWHLCDGHRSFQEIGHALRSQFGDRIEPVYDRLETFMVQMKRAQIIGWKK